MGVPIEAAEGLGEAKTAVLIIDGSIGYNLRGRPRGTAAHQIRWANRQTAPILALDVPSGLDAAAAAACDPVIRAAATMTLALPKTGLLSASALPHVGELYLADIGVPPALYAARDIVRLARC